MKRVTIVEFKKNFDTYYRLAEFENIILSDGENDLIEILLYRKNEEDKIKVTTLHPNGRKILKDFIESL